LQFVIIFRGVNIEEWKKVIYGLIISLIAGFIIGFIITKIFKTACKNVDRRKANKVIKKSQLVSGALIALMNGAQDGLKFIGIFMLAIFLSQGRTDFTIEYIPLWLTITIGVSIGVGCLIGGYKVIKTIGTKISKIEPYEAVCVDLSASICLLVSTIFGIPISSTHTKSASIMGVGASKRLSNVNWNVEKDMLISWALVFPACGFIGFVLAKILLSIVF
jgi:PiT family inorganic phosphate transporter